MGEEKTPISRVIILVFDSLGVGALPDAAAYGDVGANTIANIAAAVGGLRLPALTKLGFGLITDIKGVPPVKAPLGCFGKMAERSHGKDTTVGLWEMMGLVTENPFPVFPAGFPAEVVAEFERRIGCPVLGNKAASGTEIIEELGAEHMATGSPIVYTSADSVWQIAAHEDVVPVPRLYEMCLTARNILTGSLGVDRVIARPFKGKQGHFVRTERRKDFGLAPTEKMVLDYAKEAGVKVWSVGKVWDVFSGRGITEAVKTKNNADAFTQTGLLLKEGEPGIVFTILGEFDTVWGHRNDVEGYAKGLLEADSMLETLLGEMRQTDVLIITADHGCDPTMPGTDHTREYVPLMVYGKGIRRGVSLGERSSFSDVGKTISDLMGFKVPVAGNSFYNDIRYIEQEA
ncbi:MAG: phosphopentomutase [Actinomycetota bacterium]